MCIILISVENYQHLSLYPSFFAKKNSIFFIYFHFIEERERKRGSWRICLGCTEILCHFITVVKQQGPGHSEDIRITMKFQERKGSCHIPSFLSPWYMILLFQGKIFITCQCFFSSAHLEVCLPAMPFPLFHDASHLWIDLNVVLHSPS